ncbi:hypothetical protein LMJF_17_1210 [Leishmania major strain Friedlin]|uniref:MSP domain-containing protein n=1 Tax=Leishmania major TaxID=5664 RepID=Q4QE70_LEIMA|nr:hypothetical protein LMJF_17_1210 [Leishmania major strain Friedlin]CAG9572354.1 MSP_(Major_sperm_protein)_domain_containing_protein_-_putative [Leishmania major strain Friedlin]CAJ03935.1 hypothetical protein LMJF_17_1210 [Leishmania major strain Friedlin]|eukprot:XP_001682378.1 hypothetical protein LMJF_17_1210 [Leishmania major strain Friedlin]
MESRYSLRNESLTEGLVLASSASKHDALFPQRRYGASKAHPQIKIEPSCLVFPPPHFGRCIQNAISIYNVSKQPCVFKMRSQNPERYVAKPHVAIVAPESATRSFVTLRDMNTLGMKNLPEGTQDRFRFSLKLYNPTTVDPSLSPKDLWNLLTERGDKVDHEQDLIAYFTKRDTPVGGLVTFFPPTYIPVIPPAVPKAAPPPNSATAPTSAHTSSSTATRVLNRDGSTVAQRKKAAGAAGGGATSHFLAASDAVKEWAKAAATMRGLWLGVFAAALIMLSVAVVTSRMWGAGDAAAGRMQATAASGCPAPQAHAMQAGRADYTVPAAPPPNHAEPVTHYDVPAAKPVQTQQHPQHHGEHPNIHPKAASPIVGPPYAYHKAPPAQEEVHHNRHEHWRHLEAPVEPAVAGPVHGTQAEQAAPQEQQWQERTLDYAQQQRESHSEQNRYQEGPYARP